MEAVAERDRNLYLDRRYMQKKEGTLSIEDFHRHNLTDLLRR